MQRLRLVSSGRRVDCSIYLSSYYDPQFICPSPYTLPLHSIHRRFARNPLSPAAEAHAQVPARLSQTLSAYDTPDSAQHSTHYVTTSHTVLLAHAHAHAYAYAHGQRTANTVPLAPR